MSARARIHSQVATALADSATRMKKSADSHRRPHSLLVGDRVWLATTHLPLKHGSRKLSAKWTGPFRLVEQVAAEAWRLELPGAWRIHDVFHSSQLKPVHGSPRVPEPIALEDEGQAAEFEVERLLDRRRGRGRAGWQYLVRWKGYGAHEDTWEPVANL